MIERRAKECMKKDGEGSLQRGHFKRNENNKRYVDREKTRVWD
jgi:hypothetical protein